MEGLQKSHVLKVEELSRRKLTEDQNTIMELKARIQELQNEFNCMNDSRDFKDAESIRSGLSHVPSQTALLPPHRDPGGLLSRNNQPPDIPEFAGYIWKRFCKSTSVFFVTLSRKIQSLGLERNGRRACTHKYGEARLHVVNVRFHSLNSEIAARTVSRKFIRPLEEKILQELRCRPTKDWRSRNFTLTNSPTPTTFACWKIRFMTEVCTCSQVPAEAMLWIKEVEMV